ncbi:Fc.00g111290.m01.CDS01 [Cosmosporella sp. VM-42]
MPANSLFLATSTPSIFSLPPPQSPSPNTPQTTYRCRCTIVASGPIDAPNANVARPLAIPSTLPPSVEEAYRRKCVQLKNRTNEVEDANDAARLRLARIKRQVEKLRIERAFLLEQLAKRTSTNVEDSDGSPSPPPTENHFAISSEPDANPRKPKDKPLRTKRGHKKSMMGDGEAKGTAASNQAHSPTSESFSHPPDSQTKDARNGVSKGLKKPADAYEVYCNETRPILEAKNKDGDGDVNVEEELASGWKDLPEAEKDEFQAKFELATAKDSEPKEATPEKKDAKADDDKPQTQDEDVEMGNYDTDGEQEAASGEKAD